MRTSYCLVLGALVFASACSAFAGTLPPPPAAYKVAQDALSDALKAGGRGDGVPREGEGSGRRG
jgi:hypothetical protein